MKLKTAGVIVGVCLIILAFTLSLIFKPKDPNRDVNTSTPISTQSVAKETENPSSQTPTDTQSQQPSVSVPEPSSTNTVKTPDSKQAVKLNSVPVFNENFEDIPAYIKDRQVVLEGSCVRYYLTLSIGVFDNEIITNIEVFRDVFTGVEGLESVLVSGGFTSFGSQVAIDVRCLEIK